MSLEEALFTALAPVTSNRVYPSTFPQSFTYPAIRYSFVDVVPIVDLCGDGDDETAVPRIQMDAVATTFDGARALRLAIMAAMRTFDPPAILENSSMAFDSETKSHRAILEYTIHGSSSAMS